MTHNEIRDRLLLIARDRLRNRPGAYGQFQHAIENTVRGVAMISAAHLMPHVWQVGEQMGNQKATELVREHLTRIVDEWAQSQPLPPAVEPLPGAEPPPIGPARADTRDTATPAPVVPDSASNAPAMNPPPVATGDIAHAFDGLRGWNEKAWKDTLGSPPKWLEACIALRGERGKREHHWNPVFIGAALVDKGHARANNIRARFQTKPQLSAWLEAWKTYEADNCDTP